MKKFHQSDEDREKSLDTLANLAILRIKPLKQLVRTRKAKIRVVRKKKSLDHIATCAVQGRV